MESVILVCSMTHAREKWKRKVVRLTRELIKMRHELLHDDESSVDLVPAVYIKKYRELEELQKLLREQHNICNGLL